MVLAALLGGWALVRAATWEPLFPAGVAVPLPTLASEPIRSVPATRPAIPMEPPAEALVPVRPVHPAPSAPPLVRTAPPLPQRAVSYPASALPQTAASGGAARGSLPEEAALPTPSPADRAARPLPPEAPVVQPLIPSLAPQARTRRWTGDAWLLLRRDTTTPVTSGRPGYGRSQAGAVLRYSLAPSSAHRPTVYTRVSKALGGAREGELAAGLAVRPIPAVPVSVAAEARAFDSPVHREIRPAAFAVSELPSARLPLGFRGEVYLAGGYVGGENATAFADGQARADRPLARWGAGTLQAGGGVWGGVQEGAGRLDVGPTASIALGLGRVNARVAADWRFRVAGNAEPSSGPALTISAGF